MNFPFHKKKPAGNSYWHILFFLLPVMLYVSCNQTVHEKKAGTGQHDQNDTRKQKPPGSFSDTIIIDFPVAVFYNPDSLQLEKIKAITEPKIFNATMHDCFYQMRNSRIVLKKFYPQIKVMDVANVSHLLFENSRGEKTIIDLNTKNDPCGLFIFDRKKTPRLADMTNIETELGFYFSKN